MNGEETEVVQIETRSIQDLELQRFIDLHTGDGRTRFEIQYYDDPECWTVPVLLTAERAERIKNDYSISRIRFTLQSRVNVEPNVTYNESIND